MFDTLTPCLKWRVLPLCPTVPNLYYLPLEFMSGAQKSFSEYRA